MLVVTHSGSFHADDVLGVAILKILFDFELRRTRDQEVIARADIALDVGDVYAPGLGRFDHHQKGGAGARENGMPFASAGLIWRHYGAAAVHRTYPDLSLEDTAEVVKRIDSGLIRHVDAADVGHAQAAPGNYGFASYIDGFNPTWADVGMDADQAFDDATRAASLQLKNLMRQAAARIKAREVIRKSLRQAGNNPILELPSPLPWQETVCGESPHTRFVVFPREHGDWLVQAVPVAPGSFSSHMLFPEAWGGLRDADLGRVSGAVSAKFCHNNRHLCVCRSREDALKMAGQGVPAPARTPKSVRKG